MIFSENRRPLFGIMRTALPSDDAHRDARHVSLQHITHEQQRDQNGDEDHQNLRDENQSQFLDLRQRLKQRDDDADNEADQHQRRRDEHERDDGVARDIEDFGSGHQIGILIISSYAEITLSRIETIASTATSVSLTAVTTSTMFALPAAMACAWPSDLRPASTTEPIASFTIAPKLGPAESLGPCFSGLAPGSASR